MILSLFIKYTFFLNKRGRGEVSPPARTGNRFFYHMKNY